MARKTIEFGMDGRPVEAGDEADDNDVVAETLDEEQDEEQVEEGEQEEGGEGDTEEQPQGQGKIRIGDQFFDTQEEALEFARSQVSNLETQNAIADAYRQGVSEARAAVNPQQSVTPQEDASDDSEFFSNPTEFLKKFGDKVRTQTAEEIRQEMRKSAADEQVWMQFANRHPELTEFRSEAEELAKAHQAEFQVLAKTKGPNAVYDLLALRMKAKFARYNDAVKPGRKLPNGGGNATPVRRSASVTPKNEPKKVLSFAEQLRQHRVK